MLYNVYVHHHYCRQSIQLRRHCNITVIYAFVSDFFFRHCTECRTFWFYSFLLSHRHIYKNTATKIHMCTEWARASGDGLLILGTKRYCFRFPICLVWSAISMSLFMKIWIYFAKKKKNEKRKFNPMRNVISILIDW